MKVKILKKYVQTGEHYGKKDQVLDLPEPIARQWIAQKSAEAAKEKANAS